MVDEEEVWKVYPDYPFVEVSNLGRVRTKDRTVTRSNGRKQFVKGRVLKQRLRLDGYMDVSFQVNGKQFHLLVHRLVATCFISNPNNLPQINHIDCNRSNNIVSNLEWCTNQYNIDYREKYGMSAEKFTKALRKPVIAVDLNGFKVLWFESQSEASRQLGIALSHINNVVKGRKNKTHGYCFCYADESAIEKTMVKFGDEVAEEVEKLMREN